MDTVADEIKSPKATIAVQRKMPVTRGSAACSNVLCLNSLPLGVITRYVLQQDPSVKQACDLLTVSKVFHAAVLSGCKGLLPVGTAANPEQHVTSLATWLAKYGALAKTLTVGNWLDQYTHVDIDQDTAYLPLADALQQAAAADGGHLYISACRMYAAELSVVAAFLQAAAAAADTLVELEIDLKTDLMLEQLVADANLTTAAGALSQLSRLERLDLDIRVSNPVHMVPNALVMSLGSLQQLTELKLSLVEVSSSLQHLPVQLKCLTCSFERTGSRQAVRLEHLTSLTSLQAGSHFIFMADDLLPPNLVSLVVGDVWSPRCLLPLTRLKQLSICEAVRGTMSASDLQQLSSLPALADVHLIYYGQANCANSAAAGWSRLPISELKIVGDQQSDVLSHSALQELVHLPRLQTLSMHSVQCSCTAQTFADILQQLTSLTILGLGSVTFANHPDVEADEAAPEEDFEPIAAALRCLPQLRELLLTYVPIYYRAALQISKLSQIVSLEVADCDLEDASLSAIVFGLAATLQDIDFSGNSDITNAVLPVLWNTMGRVAWDHFIDTRVTQEAWELFMDKLSYE